MIWRIEYSRSFVVDPAIGRPGQFTGSLDSELLVEPLRNGRPPVLADGSEFFLKAKIDDTRVKLQAISNRSRLKRH